MNLTQVAPSQQGIGWRADAACAGVGADLFFSGGTTGDALTRTEAAKAICGTCRCRHECLAFALETNQEFGVWGGASEEERRRLRRGWLTQGRTVC